MTRIVAQNKKEMLPNLVTLAVITEGAITESVKNMPGINVRGKNILLMDNFFGYKIYPKLYLEIFAIHETKIVLQVQAGVRHSQTRRPWPP